MDYTRGAISQQQHETVQECRTAFHDMETPPPPPHPTLFNDSRPCFFLWINYLSLFQWQSTAHWSRPFLKPRHTSGIYCKLKARVCSTQTCTIKLPSFRFFFQNQRDPRQLNPSNADMLGYSQWHLASQRHAGKKQKDVLIWSLKVMANWNFNEMFRPQQKNTIWTSFF